MICVLNKGKIKIEKQKTQEVIWQKDNEVVCDVIVSQFDLQSRYYFYFQTTAFGKVMNPTIPTSHGLNSRAAVLLQEGFSIK